MQLPNKQMPEDDPDKPITVSLLFKSMLNVCFNNQF